MNLICLGIFMLIPVLVSAQNDKNTWPDKNDTSTYKTLLHSSGKILKPEALKITSLVINAETFLSNDKFLNQETQNAYVRTSVSSEFSFFKLPFIAGGLLSSENNTQYRRVNNFYISFNARVYREMLQKERSDAEELEMIAQNRARQLLKRRIDSITVALPENYKKGSERIPSSDEILGYTNNLSYHIYELEKKTAFYDKKLNDPDYMRDVERQRTLLDNIDSNEVSKPSKRVKTARTKMDEHERLEKEREYYATLKKMLQQFDTDLSMERLRAPGLQSASKLEQEPFANKWGKFMQDVKRVDVGFFNASYSTLVIDGASILGANLEYNNRRMYLAALGGVNDVNLNNPFEREKLGRKLIIAGRAGYGNMDKAILILTLLKGDNQNPALWSNKLYNQPDENYVTGFQYIWNINTYIKAELEYARSLVKGVLADEDKLTNNSSLSLLVDEDNKYTEAFYGKLGFKSKSEKTKVQLSYKRVEPLFFSSGAPYLRKDNERMEIKADNRIYKTNITLTNAVRHDRDNLSGLKAGTSTLISLLNTLNFKIKRSIRTSITYSPIIQNYYSTVDAMKLRSIIHSISFNTAYTIKGKTTINTLNIGAAKIFTESNLAFKDTAEIGFSQNNIYLVDNLYLRNHDINVLLQGNYIAQGRYADSSDIIMMNASVLYKLFNKKIEISNGTGIQADLKRQTRYITSYSLSWNISKTTRAFFSHDIQFVKDKELDKKRLHHVFRINFIISVMKS